MSLLEILLTILSLATVLVLTVLGCLERRRKHYHEQYLQQVKQRRQDVERDARSRL